MRVGKLHVLVRNPDRTQLALVSRLDERLPGTQSSVLAGKWTMQQHQVDVV